MTWILIPFSARVLNMRWATPAWLRMPTPMTETFTTFESGRSSANFSVAWLSFRTFMARSRSALVTVKVRSVVSPPWDTFCTIMSTLMLASDSGPKIAAATPGRSGTRVSVIFASSRL